MVTSAVAQETVFALRRKIARIEGTLAETLDPLVEPDDGTIVMRRHGVVSTRDAIFSTSVNTLDVALGGGLPNAALTEIHGLETRDAGAVAGFVLSLCAVLSGQTKAPMPVLWIGTAEIFGEAGFPYAIGLSTTFGLSPDDMLFAEVPKLVDALWIAEEAASLKTLAAVILEIRGNPSRLDLNATRRLHVRAQQALRPVFLIRHAANAEPTAAPVRLVISPAQAGLRETIAGPLPRSIGPPAFVVTISKSRIAKPGQFTLEWNADGRVFHDRKPALERRGVAYPRTEDFSAVLSLSRA